MHAILGDMPLSRYWDAPLLCPALPLYMTSIVDCLYGKPFPTCVSPATTREVYGATPAQVFTFIEVDYAKWQTLYDSLYGV